MTHIALRVDVDTFRGTREGVPRLIETLGKHGVTASFFFSVGPDNMGRHLRRLLKPRFLAKMLRSKAASLYGWDILLAGTFWPGRLIGANLAPVIRAAAEAGHEIGLHAWDHYSWQAHAGQMTPERLRQEIGRGVDALTEITGRRPDCSAAAGWICNERVLEAKEPFGFRFNSDCRGRSVFRPIVGGKTLTPQIPTTLPTYDELIGRSGIDDENYNDRLLELVTPSADNVLAVHAEVEGIALAQTFSVFLETCLNRGIELMPLGRLIDSLVPPAEPIAQRPIPGREGDVCWQRSALAA
jgi:undecaprenyl phosphate-alpha-L-ara4FN deformylase